MVENTTPVVILAGGLGSRLWPVSDIWPKALIPVAGKPCLRWIVEELDAQGFRNLILCVNDGQEHEFQFALQPFKVQVLTASKETSICTRILQAGSYLRDTDSFLVVYGDDLTHTDYGKLLAALKQGDVALATTNHVTLEFGLIKTHYPSREFYPHTPLVKEFIEKPNLIDTSASLSGDCIWIGRVAIRFSSLEELVGREDLARDVFPAMLRSGKRIVAVNGAEPWFDVGSIAHWRRANEKYASAH